MELEFMELEFMELEFQNATIGFLKCHYRLLKTPPYDLTWFWENWVSKEGHFPN